VFLEVLVISVGKFAALGAKLDQRYLLPVFFEKLLAELCTVLAHFCDWRASHGPTVVYDKT
jgi:hypothetical protein